MVKWFARPVTHTGRASEKRKGADKEEKPVKERFFDEQATNGVCMIFTRVEVTYKHRFLASA